MWRNLSNNAKNKIEILTELYARTKIALRDEVKSDVLRKNIIVNSKGYPDLIQKDFLEKSRLDFDREAVKNLNEAVVKDLESLQKTPSNTLSNISKFNFGLASRLMLQAAAAGIRH